MTDWSNALDNLKPKLCAVCHTIFQPRSGVHKFCSERCKGRWKYITGVSNTANQYANISGNWSRYFDRLITRGVRRNDGLTRQILLDKLESQEGRCALSGVPLTCILEVGKISKTNASIDRIEAGGPYTAENIQLVCRAVNSWRSDTDLQEFIWWCKQVTSYQEGKG